MVRLLTVDDVTSLVHQVGLPHFFSQLMDILKEDFIAWDEFYKSPRHAVHLPFGVLELMPICSRDYYAYKYVNGHPNNPKQSLQTIVAMGMLADVASGYPLMISEMTLLTAFRTAAITALVSQSLAEDQTRLALIGCGAQAEFQAQAMCVACPIETIYYYDVDPLAMKKFSRNVAGSLSCELIACKSAKEAVTQSSMITTCTADKKKAIVLRDEWLQPGQHINGLGGDCPGKTEFDQTILQRGPIFVEYLEQTQVEGEIQVLSDVSHCIELHRLFSGKHPGRSSANEITIYDSVGFSLEDYSVLRYIYQLAIDHNGGTSQPMIPDLSDPKDLFSALANAAPIQRVV